PEREIGALVLARLEEEHVHAAVAGFVVVEARAQAAAEKLARVDHARAIDIAPDGRVVALFLILADVGGERDEPGGGAAERMAPCAADEGELGVERVLDGMLQVQPLEEYPDV